MARRRPKKQPLSVPRPRGGLPVDDVPLPEHLKQINLDAAGIDIGSRQHYVAVPPGRDTVDRASPWDWSRRLARK